MGTRAVYKEFAMKKLQLDLMLVIEIRKDTWGYGSMEASKFEERTKKELIRLNLGHWRVCWLPDPSYPIRGRVVLENKFSRYMTPMWKMPGIHSSMK